MPNLVPSMNEIAKKLVNSLSNRINPSKLRFSGDTIILLDTSISMDSLTDGSIRRIDALRQALKEVNTSGVRMFQFNSIVEEITMETDLVPQGSTFLLQALIDMRGKNPKNLIVITDGEPSNPESCLDYASNMDCTINTVFVGNPDNHKAIQFCQKLSNQNNGQFISNPLQVKTLSALPSAIRLMLGDGTDGKGPIAL